MLFVMLFCMFFVVLLFYNKSQNVNWSIHLNVTFCRSYFLTNISYI
jgi:hypothetical protein